MKEYGSPIDIPILEPGTDGGIFIHWENEMFELLINILDNPAKPVIFSGGDYGCTKVKGTIEIDKLQEIYMLHRRILGKT